ncbi:MAG: sodium:solute symporter [Flavobacteriales bacterium]|nr:sodium:solute symporter [Flavobacteriales bacterium]
MTPLTALSLLAGYFGVLIWIAWKTGRKATTTSFFTADHAAPWTLVAFGMIGASISGVTFISVPGQVAKTGYLYFQVVVGYVLGYLVVGTVLMPLYYRLGLISIYEYLGRRFGPVTYRTGVVYFMMSRTLGSALRLMLTAGVLHTFIFSGWGLPFELTVVITLGLIWIYTFRGGIKTIVFTDTFQTLFLIGGAVICLWTLACQLGNPFHQLIDAASFYSWWEFEDYKSPLFFLKQILGGMFVTIAMTGLDQDLMQKNLTCANLRDAQKNMLSFTLILVVVNIIFLLLGGMMYRFATTRQLTLPEAPDAVFPMLALSHLGGAAAIFFLLGITASSYASADSALAALTTSFCIDILQFSKISDERRRQKIKTLVHLGFSILFIVIILVARRWADRALIDVILKSAGYTYGPLLGLFFYGLLTRRSLPDRLTPLTTLSGPASVALLDYYLPQWWDGYRMGYEILLVNGVITFVFLHCSALIFKKNDA